MNLQNIWLNIKVCGLGHVILLGFRGIIFCQLAFQHLYTERVQLIKRNKSFPCIVYIYISKVD